MLNVRPPGQETSAINRQMPQGLAAPGPQRTALSGGGAVPGQYATQPSGLINQPTMPPMQGQGGPPMPPPGLGGQLPSGAMGRPMPPPGGGGAPPGMLGMPPPGMSMGGAPGSPMSTQPPQGITPPSSMTSPMGQGMNPMAMNTGMGSPQGGMGDPQVQSAVNALAKPGLPTPTY